MGKVTTYFDYAENDYNFLLEDYKNNRVGNIMCSSSQCICERYLKHIVSLCTDIDTTSVLRTHSLMVLKKFLKENVTNFYCNWNVVLLANGFYFSARYPNENKKISICMYRGKYP